MVITEQDFDQWKQDEVTKQHFKNLYKVRERIKEDVILGHYDNDDFARGKAMALLDLLEMDYNQFMEGTNE